MCRRITLLVCLAILTVEMAFLPPTYVKRRDELRSHQEMEVLLTAKASLSWYEQHTPADILKRTWPTFEHVAVEGVALYAENGVLLGSQGRRPDLLSNEGMRGPTTAHEEQLTFRHFPEESGAYEVLWPPSVSNLPFTVVARLGTAAIDAELNAYMFRVGVLILILSMAVSVVTVAVLGRSVLTPLLAIHKNLTAAHSDPVNAEQYKLDIKADNEIGETVTVLNALLSRLSAIRRSHVYEREKRFQDFVASSSDWFWEMDENLRFCFFSDRYTDVTGVPETVLLGKTREETGIPGVDQSIWQQHLNDLHSHRPFRNFVHPRQRPNGDVVWLSINGDPWFDGDGNFRGYRGTGRDITDQMAIQEALRTAKEEAEAANRTKSEFLANISHELRTPLNAIIGFSEVMLAGEKTPGANPRHHGYLEDIHSSGLHLLSLINDILDLSKIEAGADELDEEAVDAAELARAVLRVVRQRAETSGVTIEWSGDMQLPLLFADERKLKQALLNLMTNAIKFTPSGGRVRMSIRCSAEEGFIFEVTDNGIGMAPEDIPTALRQFGQIDSALNRKYEGTGLGLPLTSALVELHGGRLEVESQLGEGTKVSIHLPAGRILERGSGRRESAGS
ncbi:sensor histidine kinase [Pelagibius marinus]|uniref:sensor histidine kinase n=1 Tax=Pelagibius marinus TaxID=2762760 RepID=UPI001872A296|nr:PAS domain-containing sensor histidine kinase [Pelagibius marinus]